MILLLIFLWLVLPSMGQEDFGTISGRVLLNERRPGDFAASIQIELVAINRPGESSRAMVNSEGEFRFLNVKGGGYFINAMAPGYKSVKTQIELIGGTQVRGNTKLVLFPEHPVSAEGHQGEIVSRNELKAPKNAVKQVEIAERRLEEDDLATAAGAIEKALTVYPNYARAHFQRGRILEKQGRVRGAIESYQKTIEVDSNFFPAYAALAEVFRLEAQYATLGKLTANWKKAQPLEATPYYYSALAYFESGEFRLAVEDALMAARFPHQNLPHLSLLLANCYIKLHDPQAAAAQMQEFLASRPDDPMVPQVQRSLEAIRQVIHR
jgi:tetratricopeptide (TPR) repeat protein